LIGGRPLTPAKRKEEHIAMLGENRTDGLRRLDERQIPGKPMVVSAVTATVVIQNRGELAPVSGHPQVALEAKCAAMNLDNLRGGR